MLEVRARWRRDGQLDWQKWLSVPRIALNIGYERRAIETVPVMEDRLFFLVLAWTGKRSKGTMNLIIFVIIELAASYHVGGDDYYGEDKIFGMEDVPYDLFLIPILCQMQMRFAILSDTSKSLQYLSIP